MQEPDVGIDNYGAGIDDGVRRYNAFYITIGDAQSLAPDFAAK